MSEGQTLTCTGPACEGKKLIIEVMGTAQSKSHTFRLFDAANQQQQEWLESQMEDEKLDRQILHVWPWEGSEKKNVWLDIAAEKGAPIRVPLFNDVEATPRQTDEQWNRIWPMVPITLLTDPEPVPGHPKNQSVPVRPGFLYIFRNGQLWRELEVINNEAGHLSFQDVRLLDYRHSEGEPLTKDRRPAVGKPLESVWLPVRGMAGSLTVEFDLAFSEVQWSADRIAYLEANTNAQSERCTTPGNPNHTQAPEKAGQWAALAGLPAMRTRESYLEQHLPAPWKSVHDLSGNYASDLYQKAVDEQQAFAQGGKAAESAWEAANYRDAKLRGASSVRLAALEAPQSSEYTVSLLWQSLDPATDALAPVRQNGWGVLVLDDPLFRVRQTLAQATDAQHYLTLLTEMVGKQPHTDSAQLVYRVMGPELLGGKENPLHKHLDEIDTGYFGRLHHTLRSAERKLALEEITLGQKRFFTVIKHAENQRTLADLFTLKGADYIEGFALSQSFIQALAIDPMTADKLRINKPNVEEAYTKQCQTLLVNLLTEGSGEPLHKMLFPEDDGDGNAKSPEDGKNCGDGRCRPKDIEALALKKPDAEGLQTLYAVALAGIAKSESLNLTTETKRWLVSVNAIFDGIHKLATAATTRLGSHAQQLNARLYSPQLRLAKARDPKLLGPVKLVTRASVPSDWVIIGVTDPEKGRSFGLTPSEREQYVNAGNHHKRFYGEFYQPDSDTPLASTNRARMPDLGDTPEAHNMHVYAAPASSEVNKAHREMRLYKRWDELAENVRLPYFIVVIEAFNIMGEKKIFDRIRANRGRARAYLGFGSAGFDLLVASTLSTERLLLDIGKGQLLKQGLDATSFSISKNLVARVSQRLADALPRMVSYRLLGGLISGGLIVAVSLMDMAHELDTGDTDAGIANGVSAVGGVMMLMGGLMGSGANLLLLGMGPAVWLGIGLALAIGGGIAAVLLNDPPLVDWLKRGPFGTEQDDLYDHMVNNPSEAYYRLAGLLSRPRIALEPVDNFTVSLTQKHIAMEPKLERHLSSVNFKVSIENNIASFLDESNLNSELRLVDERKTISHTPNSSGFPTTRRTVREDKPDVLLEQPLINGKAYYLRLPPSTTKKGLFKTVIKGSSVAVRAQWQASWNNERQFYFPAPELDNPLSFDPAENGKPDFSKVDEPFWADEQNDRAEGEKG